jgi:hypothetical protein
MQNRILAVTIDEPAKERLHTRATELLFIKDHSGRSNVLQRVWLLWRLAWFLCSSSQARAAYREERSIDSALKSLPKDAWQRIGKSCGMLPERKQRLD